MRAGAPEAPYNRPPGSPRRQPAARPQIETAPSAKEPGKLNQERLRSQERMKELHEILIRETCKLSDPRSTTEDRMEAARVIQQATTEMARSEDQRRN
jgi:hypothetical protein